MGGSYRPGSDAEGGAGSLERVWASLEKLSLSFEATPRNTSTSTWLQDAASSPEACPVLSSVTS